MRIPVVFATDEKYLFYTVVAITSMAENAGTKTFYHIYILVSGVLKTGHCLLTSLQKKYTNIDIKLLPVRADVFQNVHINNSHVTKTTFYRLMLSELLPVKRCIYLDSDMIVNTDLEELYVTDIGENYIAGVRDLWIDLMQEEKKEERRIRSSIPSLEQYVNAGTLLLNLEQIRKDNLIEQFRNHMEKDYPYEDQDIVNVCCYGRITRLPAKWNLFTLFMGRLDELEQKGIDRETIRHMKEMKGIIHYATPFIRPWESERFLCNDIWWEYAANWAETSEYQELRKEMRMREIAYSQEALADYCAKYEKIYIWGFTGLGRNVFSELQENGVDNIVGFIDNDVEKQKFTYCGKTVQPFSTDICDRRKSAIIITSQKSGKEIQQFLLNKGFEEADIVRYIFKDTTYYQCLRWEFRGKNE